MIENINKLSLDNNNINNINQCNNKTKNYINKTNENNKIDISDIKIQITKDIINLLNKFLKPELLNNHKKNSNKEKEITFHIGIDYPAYTLSYLSPEVFYSDIY